MIYLKSWVYQNKEGKGFNKIIQKISDKNKEWVLEEVLNYALVNETKNSN